MHEIYELELALKAEAERLSEQYQGAPVAIVIGGDKQAEIPRTVTASAGRDPLRLRDLLGLLQAAIQTESWKHFKNW